MATQATPRPWTLTAGESIEGHGRIIVAGLYKAMGNEAAPVGERQANTALIVRAVNSHDALVEALGKAQAGLGSAIRALINRHTLDREMFLRVAEAAELDAQIAYDAVQAALKAAKEAKG